MPQIRSRKAPASTSPTAMPQRARSAADICAVVAVRRNAGEARLRDQLALDDVLRHGRVSQLLDDEGRPVDREQRDPPLGVLEVLRIAARDDAVLAPPQDPAGL